MQQAQKSNVSMYDVSMYDVSMYDVSMWQVSNMYITTYPTVPVLIDISVWISLEDLQSPEQILSNWQTRTLLALYKTVSYDSDYRYKI